MQEHCNWYQVHSLTQVDYYCSLVVEQENHSLERALDKLTLVQLQENFAMVRHFGAYCNYLEQKLLVLSFHIHQMMQSLQNITNREGFWLLSILTFETLK